MGTRDRHCTGSGRIVAAGRSRQRRRLAAWAGVAMGSFRGRARPSDAWLPVAFGLGIVGYFAADREPAWWAAVAAAIASSVAAFLMRLRPVGFPLMLAVAAIALGFAAATLQTLRIAHPI